MSSGHRTKAGRKRTDRMDSILDRPIQYLTGIGQKRAELLASEIGVATFGDMLMHIPFRYVDRSRIYKIAEIGDELSSQYIQVRARVQDVGIVGHGAKARLAAVVADDTGEMDMVWFRGIKYILKKLEAGREYIFFGRPTIFNGSPTWPIRSSNRPSPWKGRSRSVCRAYTAPPNG